MKIDLPWFTSLVAFGLGSIALVAMTLAPPPADADHLEHAIEHLDDATERLESVEGKLEQLQAQLAAQSLRPATVVMPPERSATPEPKRPLPLAADAIICVQNRCVVDHDYVKSAFYDPATFSRQARVVPAMRDGEQRGFKLYGMRPGSAGRALGLKNGDLITAVGGHPLTDVSGLGQAVESLRDIGEFTVDFERRGDRHRIHVELR